MLKRPLTNTIRGAASPDRAARSSARLRATKTCAASAAEPPVVPDPAAAQPSFGAKGWRASHSAAGEGPRPDSARLAAPAGGVMPSPRAVTTATAAAARDRPRMVRSKEWGEESAYQRQRLHGR